MRFERIQVPAFGPFTNLDLQFAEHPNDFHVIYGVNEAGKSALLRAIRDLLFGIHNNSTDNFLYGFSELRIKGSISNRTGDRLLFQRRKGNKNTLLDEQEHPLPDGALIPFLGSVDRAYFSSMFGIGATELHDGAQQLLRGEGNLGTALFSASLGGTPVQKVVEALQQEAEQLYRGRATANVSIRPTVNRYKDLLKQSREAMINPETWDKMERELAEAEATKKLLEEDISKLERELQWISRCEDALPTVGRLNEATQRLAKIPSLPSLANDFVPRTQTARKAVGAAQAEVQRLKVQVGKFQALLQSCQTKPAVLAEATVLDQLHQDLGVFKERKKSLTDLEATLAGLDSLIRSGMQNLGLTGEFASLKDYRLSSPNRIACETAAEELKATLTEQLTNADKIEDREVQVILKESQLRSLPEADLTNVRDALEIAAEATEADRTLSLSDSEVQKLTRETASQHRLLANAPKDIETTENLVIPSIATIRHYNEQIEGFKRDIKNEIDRITETDRRAGAIQAELARLQRQGELPSEEALHKSRERRDYGWSLVLAAWKGNGANEELLSDEPLEEAFPITIKRADEIADKLRLDAEAVAQAEEKRFQLREIEKEVASANQKLHELQSALNQCELAWQGEWRDCGITPRLPKEMEEWREVWNEFRERLSKQKTAEELFKKKYRQIQQARKPLASVLGQSEEKEFSLLFAAVKKLVQDGEQAEGRRIEISSQISLLNTELATLKNNRVRIVNAVGTSTTKWNLQLSAVGLSEGIPPDAGLILLRERKELFDKFDKWQELSNKVDTTTKAVIEYEKTINQKAVALNIIGDTTEALQFALWKALEEARKSQERHDQLVEQIKDASNELDTAQLLAEQSEQTLNDLIQLAGLTTATELEPLLAHLEQRNAIQAQIDDLRNTLGGLARGQSVDAFIAKVCAENFDAFAERKPIIVREKAEKESALPGLNEGLFQLRNQKQTFEMAGDTAADFRQQAESCAATLKQDAARFLRLRLATYLLKNQIERFRKENQGPFLQKSGEMFQKITRNAFSGLGAEFNADDLPVLVGIRSDHSKVPVEGLSDGSRDQLFLALRLAALDRYLEDHEPIPLILDDLLITFDNERAKAILPQLGSLAKRTQIFLFTHHEHVIELCREILGNGHYQPHQLAPSSSK